MSQLFRLADRVLNCPLLITPAKMEVITSILAGRVGIGDPSEDGFVGSRTRSGEDGSLERVPYKVANGVAIIRIDGTLVNRGAYVGASSGLISYEGIKQQLKTASHDTQVKSIILDMNTPGGEAVGCAECAAIVRQVAQQKPVVALVNGMAASAGYKIASAASKIVTTSSGFSGSIGVVLVHADSSEKLKKDGVAATIIYAGDHKVDGNPFEPLPDSVKQTLQMQVDDLYSEFLTIVAEGRGEKLTTEMARATQAKLFRGEKAIEAGLADEIGSFESVFMELSSQSRGVPVSNLTNGEINMSENNATGANATATGAPDATAIAKAASSSTKARIQSITEAGQKHGTPGLAHALAFDTELSPEQSSGLMEASLEDRPKALEVGEIIPKTDEQGAKEFFEQKSQDGVLGLGTPQKQSSQAADEAAFWDDEFKG